MYNANKRLFVDTDIEYYLRTISAVCTQIDNFVDMAKSGYVVTPYTMDGIDNGVRQLIEIVCKLKQSYYADGVTKDSECNYANKND